jgi:hypothetical protein
LQALCTATGAVSPPFEDGFAERGYAAVDLQLRALLATATQSQADLWLRKANDEIPTDNRSAAWQYGLSWQRPRTFGITRVQGGRCQLAGTAGSWQL